MAEPVEELYVQIRGDVKPLMADTKKGVDQASQALGKLDGKAAGTTKEIGKIGQAFSSMASKGKAAFSVLVTAIGAAGAALAALGVAATVAFAAAEQGLQRIRTRRSFYGLADEAGQSGAAILAAMKKASAGTISEFQLIASGAEALNFKIAKTPEQFERLTESAIKLARIKGIPATEALSRLISGLGKNEVELLDELGLNLVMINNELEILAQKEYGKGAKGLTAMERQAIFAEAALNAAEKAANRLGNEVADVGQGLEQSRVAIEEFQADTDEAFTLLVGHALNIANRMKDSFFGESGVFPLFTEGSNIVAEVFARILAGFIATAGAMAQRVADTRKVLTGEMGIGDFLNPAKIAQDFQTKYGQALEKIRVDFADVLDPSAAGAGGGGGGGGGTDTTPVVKDDKITEQVVKLNAELLDLQEETAEASEKLAADHAEKVLDIESEYIQDRLKLGEKLADDLEDLDKDTAKERRQILDDAKKELSDLAAETDQELADESANFNKEERRETEDHLQQMRQLRQDYISNLTDLVTARDARGIVDLRRKYQEEKATTESNFTTEQQREREDQDQRLAEIRQNEQEKADEITAAREQDLLELAETEQEKRDELQNSYTEQLAQLDQNRAETLAEENNSYTERQAALDEAMNRRLEAIAKELAGEVELEQATAEAILAKLAETYGEEGTALAIIEEYVKRRNELLAAGADFEAGTTTTSGGGHTAADYGTGNQPSFATGGSMIANHPTLVQFGEVPELATFTPLSQVNNQNNSRNLSVTVNATGQGGQDMGEEIARVLVSALRQAGLNG